MATGAVNGHKVTFIVKPIRDGRSESISSFRSNIPIYLWIKSLPPQIPPLMIIMMMRKLR